MAPADDDNGPAGAIVPSRGAQTAAVPMGAAPGARPARPPRLPRGQLTSAITVVNLPSEKLVIKELADYFAQFGTIDNLQAWTC